MAPTVTKDVLLLRLGSRIRTEENLTDRGPTLRRLAGARECNARGIPLVYAPHSHRCHAEHVPQWVQHCRSVIHERRGRSIMEEREQLFIAMGFFTLTIMRRWKKWARREAGLRRLLGKLSVGDAFNRWKRASRLAAFQALLEHLAKRRAVHRWKRELEGWVAFESAIGHYSRTLVIKVWKAWVTHRSNTDSNYDRLRETMERWRAWQRRWKAGVGAFHAIIVRRVLASAVDRWRLENSSSVRRYRRRQEVLGHLLSSIQLRKCFAALANEAHHAATLRCLLEQYRKLNLRGGFEAWRRWFLIYRQALKTPNKEATASDPTSEICLTTIKQRGKPRKGHCRCVYAISRRERCTCAPRTHLLRRLEELHKLVAKGLDRREGGHRLLSHVVQRASAPSSFGSSFRSAGEKKRPPHTISAAHLCVVTSSERNVGGSTTNAINLRRRPGSDSSQQPGGRERRAGLPPAAATEEDKGTHFGICSSPVVADSPRCADGDIRRASPHRRAFPPSRHHGMTHW